MDLSEMQERARAVRDRYAEHETRTYGKAWTTTDLALGFVGDVGDLAKLVQAHEGMRPPPRHDVTLAHELADCLWSVLVLADATGVDLEHAFTSTMDELEGWLSSHPD